MTAQLDSPSFSLARRGYDRAEVDDRLGARQRTEAGRIVESASQEARQRIEDATGEARRLRAAARADVDAAHRELEGPARPAAQGRRAARVAGLDAAADGLPARRDGRQPGGPHLPGGTRPSPPAVPGPREAGPVDAEGSPGNGTDVRLDEPAGDGSADDDTDRGATDPRPSPAARHALTRAPAGQAGTRR